MTETVSIIVFVVSLILLLGGLFAFMWYVYIYSGRYG